MDDRDYWTTSYEQKMQQGYVRLANRSTQGEHLWPKNGQRPKVRASRSSVTPGNFHHDLLQHPDRPGHSIPPSHWSCPKTEHLPPVPEPYGATLPSPWSPPSAAAADQKGWPGEEVLGDGIPNIFHNDYALWDMCPWKICWSIPYIGWGLKMNHDDGDHDSGHDDDHNDCNYNHHDVLKPHSKVRHTIWAPKQYYSII